MGPGDDSPDAEDGRILSPEELDIADDDHVEEIAEGRYVVSPEVRTDPAGSAGETGSRVEDSGSSPDEAGGGAPPEPQLTDAAVHEWLESHLEGTNSQYGFDVTAKFGDSVCQQQMVSNDIITVFESLLLWYARQVDSTTPVEEVLGILLSESTVSVRYPPERLHAIVAASDLSPEDSIGDLLAVVADADGVQL